MCDSPMKVGVEVRMRRVRRVCMGTPAEVVATRIRSGCFRWAGSAETRGGRGMLCMNDMG